MEGNYEALANAIIIQAVKDFRAAYKRHLICPEDAKANRDIREITRFFCSQYFEALFMNYVDGARYSSCK